MKSLGKKCLSQKCVAFAVAALLAFPAYCVHTVEGSDLKEYEWATWPDYCKAAFVASEWGRSSPFRERVSADWVFNIRKTHNERIGIMGAHHTCLAMIYVSRAHAAGNKERVQYHAERALRELEYSYERTAKSAPYFSVLAAYRGTAFFLHGERDKAIQAWNEGIRAMPKKRESYLAMAQALLSEKKTKEALDVLLAYDTAKDQETPDGEYFLGYTYFELGRYDDARRHVDRAVELGYPNPGLRKKLDQLGK